MKEEAINDPYDIVIRLIEETLKSPTVRSIDELDEIFNNSTSDSEDKLIKKLTSFVDESLNKIIQSSAEFYEENAKKLGIKAQQNPFCMAMALHHATRLSECFHTKSCETNLLQNIIQTIENRINTYLDEIKKYSLQGIEINCYQFIVNPTPLKQIKQNETDAKHPPPIMLYIPGIWNIKLIVNHLCRYLALRDVYNLGITCKTLSTTIFKFGNQSTTIFNSAIQRSEFLPAPQSTSHVKLFDYGKKPISYFIDDEKDKAFYHPTIFSSFAKRIYVATTTPINKSSDRKVKIWSIDSLQCISTLECHQKNCEIISINKLTRHYLALGYTKGKMEIWDFLNQKCIKEFDFDSAIIGVIEYKQYWVAIMANGELHFIDKDGGKEKYFRNKGFGISAYERISSNQIVIADMRGACERIDLKLASSTKEEKRCSANLLIQRPSEAPVSNTYIAKFALLGKDRLLCVYNQSGTTSIHILNLLNNQWMSRTAFNISHIEQAIVGISVLNDNTVAIQWQNDYTGYGGLVIWEIKPVRFNDNLVRISSSNIEKYPININTRLFDKTLVSLPDDGRLIRLSGNSAPMEILKFPRCSENTESLHSNNDQSSNSRCNIC